MTDLRVVEMKPREEDRREHGHIYCADCNCHSFRLVFDQHREPLHVECFNCRNVMNLDWSDGPGVDPGDGGTIGS